MRITDAIKYCGSKAELARRLGLRSQSAIGNWERDGREVLPELYARRLADVSDLKFDPSMYGLHQ